MVKVLVFLMFVMFICCCSTHDQEVRYLAGGVWYHPDKTQQEMDRDFQECHSVAISAPSTYSTAKVESHCMTLRGYVWR